MPAVNILFEIARLTGHIFIAGLWQGLVLIAAVAITLRLIPRLSPALRFAIWTLAFALVLLLPFVELRPAAAHQVATTPAVHLSPVWAIAIASLWAALTLFRATQLILQSLRLRRIWQNAQPIAPATLLDQNLASPDTIALLKASRNAHLCTSLDVDSPSVIGFFSPRLLLPASLLAQLTPAELHHIVLHECEHLRRRDDWLNLAQRVALVLFPLNPALLWVDRRLSLERELACDAGVVARTSPFAYATSLTRLAEHRLHRRSLALALSAWAGRSELAHRVQTLIQPIRRLTPLQARASAAVLVLGLSAGATELARTPEFVAFTTPAAATPVADILAPTSAPSSGRAIPVSYTGATQPRATLLKAVMPAPSTQTKSALKPAIKQSARRQTLQPELHSAATPIRKPQTPRMILTTSSTSQQPANHRQTARSTETRAVYVTTEFTPSYAAVPFGDGWLIIQL